MTIRTYSTPEAFKQALEQRLRSASNSGAEITRKRQLLVFDRFLARIMDGATLRSAIEQTFRHRASHPVPASFPEPPEFWDSVYARIAESDGLEWRNLAQVTAMAQAFLNPVLAGTNARWSREAGVWSDSE